EAGFLDEADFETLFQPLKPPEKIEPTDTEEDIEDKLKKNREIELENQAELQKRRHRIARAFLPFLRQRLIRRFIVQTMTAYTAGDPALVESLLTDERLLDGPGALLDAFAATGERGVTAAFFAAGDGTGPELKRLSIPDADTGLTDDAGDPIRPAAANSARIDGYLEVPIPGAYRFHVVFDKQDAEAELHFEHLADPLFLKGKAAADGGEIGGGADEYLELKSGIPYRFTLLLHNLNGGDARLLVQGETLGKGGLRRLALYPLSAMESAARALVLLTKGLQLLQGLGFTEREARYVLLNAGDFGGLKLGDLPGAGSDDTPAGARALFKGFLRLAAYARLKREPAGGTDDLIDIFEANGKGDLGNVYTLIAKLTRRDEATVKAAAEALVAAPSFESDKPLARLWEALQLVERFGTPVASLQEWTHIVSPAATPEQRFEIARDLKEAIKARFEPETWQRVAQPIFDKLRRRQRDALVSHVMHQGGFARMEQLYEYFLIDPGMEPVVQTSRLRLAISSVQLFIQRSLLNLEPKVHPATINSKHWEWMKRYRVWEANRKIFLFPENWLEPEFRDDKTHLFAELEGALLQGDVSGDLVEDAFLNYLKKLDELARLDIVAMHIEDNPDPARRTLHVFGRTYSRPHKYFYRRYAHRMWTPWEPVSAEIEGDHLAPVVWRDRLYLFWVTFMDKPVENPQPGAKTKNATLAGAYLSDVMSDVSAAGNKKQIDVQLHWSEYLAGEWGTRQSSEFFNVMTPFQLIPVTPAQLVLLPLSVPLTVPLSFNPAAVFIHVSEPDQDGQEGGIFIHLKGPESFQHSFYLAGRNSQAVKAGYKAKPANPYSAGTERATRYSGNGALKVEFKQRITTESGKGPTVEIETPDILQQGGGHIVLPCDNNITLGMPDPASLDADDPVAVKAAIEGGLGEIASLIKPIFYQDHLHTFFVEPNVTEQTIEKWQEWVTWTPQPEPAWRESDWWKDIVVIPDKPWKWLFHDPRDPLLGFEIDRGSLINPIPDRDWLVNPGTVLEFDNVLIGPAGQPGLRIVTGEVAEAVAEGGLPVNVNPGSSLASGGAVVLADAITLEQSGLIQAAGGLNVVGGAGFNSALEKNFNELNRAGFGAGRSGAGTIGR
ncbi:MAG: hypothetical protein IBX71_03535, partial [Candidatus Desulforudis sp.]|nr:hypothetical protein [Desulforudis sp.]